MLRQFHRVAVFACNQEDERSVEKTRIAVHLSEKGHIEFRLTFRQVNCKHIHRFNKTGIFTCMYDKLKPNEGKYSIHGYYQMGWFHFLNFLKLTKDFREHAFKHVFFV